MLVLIISVVIACLDQGLKWLVVDNIAEGSRISIIDGFCYLTHIYNTGAAWGLFKGALAFFIPVTIVAVVSMIVFMFILKEKKYRFALSLILGGTIGNFIDRISVSGKGVVDYVELHFGSYVFPVFNLADSCIVVGGVLLVIYILFDDVFKKGK